MSIDLNTPSIDELGDVVLALREWQKDGAPAQLHPGTWMELEFRRRGDVRRGTDLES